MTKTVSKTTVTVRSGKTIPQDNAQKIGPYYFEIWQDCTKKIPDELEEHYVVVIPAEGDKKASKHRVGRGRDYIWCFTNNRYMLKTDSHVYGYFSFREQGWFISTENTKEVYLCNRGGAKELMLVREATPETVKRNVITGEPCLITSDTALNNVLFKPLNPKDSLGLHLHKQLSPKSIDRRGGYERFDVSRYGQDGNDAFNYCEESCQRYRDEVSVIPELAKIEESFAIKSLGLEYECFSGYVPERDCLKMGLVPVKDGSIRGTSFEYITTPIWKNLLSTTFDISKFLNNIVTSDESCSLHIHAGGIPPTKTNVVALWMLLSKLGNEFFEMIPAYKKELAYLNNKPGGPKDHCKSFPTLGLIYKLVSQNITKETFIENSFNEILLFLNEGNVPKKTRDGYEHCKARNNKWERNTRYYSVNFLTWLFENKKTIEFRTHSPTTNPYKVINWILIINAVINFAVNNSDEIFKNGKIDLADVINFTYPEKVAIYLNDYVISRKLHFSEKYAVGDIYGGEFDKDNEYVFLHKYHKEVYGEQ